MIFITDTLCAKVFKEWVGRIRPCAANDLISFIRPLIHCSNGYSFPSCHSTNHFALASFWGYTLLSDFKKYLYFWAVMIAFGQVYVGVHYPLDVVCGAVLGSFIGWIISLCFFKKYTYV